LATPPSSNRVRADLSGSHRGQLAAKSRGKPTVNETDRSIDGVAKTIAEVLEKKKYSIDYYQREYKWEAKQLTDLVNDLTTKFLDLYDAQHARKEVACYPGYYLGSIIISQKGSEPFIVDGQQRLTTLTLLLTFLRRLQHEQERADAVDIDQLIFSEKFGEKSFNLDIADRRECMESLFEKGSYEPPQGASESVYTLVARYEELDELFPDDLRKEALPYFIDWLKDRVQLVHAPGRNGSSTRISGLIARRSCRHDVT
jgi:uncharacterized protein with ParB-like and HNH nuclease domain